MVMEIKSDSIKYVQLIIVLALATLLFAITSCSGTKTAAKTSNESKTRSVPTAESKPILAGSKLSSNIASLDLFLDGFESATLTHNPSNILTYLDKAYKKEQWETYLDKNTDSFFNKFYSNNQMVKGKPAIDYKTISKITRLKFNYQVSYTIVTYLVEAEGKKIELDLTVFSKLEKGELKYSIYGPIG